MTEQKDRLPFQTEPEEFEPTKGVKLQRKKSFVSKQSMENREQQKYLENTAQDIVKRRAERLSLAFELGKEYKEILADKTVPSQAGELRKSKEVEVISKLINFAIESNNDEDEMEGMGSVTLSTLLLKVLLQMRDRYNELDYKCHQLQTYASRLEVKINNLSRGSDDKSE